MALSCATKNPSECRFLHIGISEGTYSVCKWQAGKKTKQNLNKCYFVVFLLKDALKFKWIKDDNNRNGYGNILLYVVCVCVREKEEMINLWHCIKN